MKKAANTTHRRWMIVLTLVSLSLLWSYAMPSMARADAPGAICTLKIAADGKVVGNVANRPRGFDIVALIAETEAVNVPVLCDSLKSLALSVANQENQQVTVNLEIFSQDGVSICTKEPFSLAVNGGRGATFADCP
jgi:hypothetical protein